MKNDGNILSAKGGFLIQTFRASGLMGCLRKLLCALKMSLPLIFFKHRTNDSVAAYFDLITDDARLFYDDNFHFGFFHQGATTLKGGLDTHTDMVATMAELEGAKRVLDIGCGIGAPAIRIARQYQGEHHITGINISHEQVKQGKALIAEHQLCDRIHIQHGNALKLDFADNSFDSILCLEVAGDICVNEEQKKTLLQEMFRVLKPGGHVGFSDLVFTRAPTVAEDAIMKTILYHKGSELVTDWSSHFKQSGFHIKTCVDMILHTAETWVHSLKIYQDRLREVEQRYGKKIAKHTMNALKFIPGIMAKYGVFIVLSAQKPFDLY
jgi:cyclopropane fatty-acyl-phospholipid synthase-like methyltransferase